MSMIDTFMSILSPVTSFLNIGSNNDDNNHRGSYSTSTTTSSTVTTYDPDKIEVAKLENERVDLVKNAQLELMEVNARLEVVMLEAKCKGFDAIGASVSRMKEEITQFSNDRYILLQEGNFEHIKKIESMYADLTNDLNNNDFLIVRMPQMLEIANKYPEDSDLHKLYMKGIELEMANSINFKNEQIRLITTRCQQAIDSANASKAQMNEHINKLIEQTHDLAIKTLHVNTQLNHNEAVTQITDNSSNQLKIDHKS